MTYWRTPRPDRDLRLYRSAWLTLTISLLLGAVALFAWGSARGQPIIQDGRQELGSLKARAVQGAECPPDKPHKRIDRKSVV